MWTGTGKLSGIRGPLRTATLSVSPEQLHLARGVSLFPHIVSLHSSSTNSAYSQYLLPYAAGIHTNHRGCLRLTLLKPCHYSSSDFLVSLGFLVQITQKGIYWPRSIMCLISKGKHVFLMCYFSFLSPKCTQYSYQCFGKTNVHCTVGLTVDLLAQCPTCGTACKTLVLCSLLIFLGTYRYWHSITEKLLVPSNTL